MSASFSNTASPGAALSATQRRVLAAVQDGLPLVPRPYATVAANLGLDETAVLATIAQLRADGILKRLGLVVRHHELGYCANAMTVFDVDAARVDAAGAALAELSYVTLCYQRRRAPGRPPAP